MSLETKILYTLKDIATIPAAITDISSRSEINPYYVINGYNFLPVFASPMGNVLNEENSESFKSQGIIPIIPRTVSFEERIKCAIYKHDWIALSLDEFYKCIIESEKLFDNILCDEKNNPIRLLIDVANGHMQKILDYVKIAREKEKQSGLKFEIMTGNIANPSFILELYKQNVHIDYLRIGIGYGSCCQSSAELSIHYPLASLIDTCKNLYKYVEYENPSFKLPKLIADGGIRTYADAIKCLALGADYVMIGTAFAALYESTSDFYIKKKYSDNSLDIMSLYQSYEINEETEKIKQNRLSLNKGKLFKRNYGMSTYEAQSKIKKDANIKLTEGIERYIPCNKTIKDWVYEFTGYLRSCMSYCNTRTLNEFINNVTCVVISPNTANTINKPLEAF